MFRIARNIIATIAIWAFVLAGGQFAHAETVEHSHTHVHAAQGDGAAHSSSINDRAGEQNPYVGGIHCGAFLLTLASVSELSSVPLALEYERESPSLPDSILVTAEIPPPRA